MNSQYVKNQRYGYPLQTGQAVLSAAVGKQLLVHSMAVINGDTSSQDLGIAITFNTQGSQVLAEISAVVAPLVAGPVLAGIGDKLYFQAKSPADLFAFSISTPGVVGPGVLAYEYWNGSAWTALTPQNALVITGASAGVIIGAPLDWEIGDGGITELSASLYSFRIVVSTAFTTPPEVSNIQVARFYTFRQEIEAKQALEASFEENQSLLETGESLMPYFGSSSNFNSVELGWRINP